MTGIKFVSFFFCYYGGINVHVVNSRFTYNNGSNVLLNSNLGMLYADIKKNKTIHYQKINNYKRKYRENISVGKFPRDFTDGNIPSVYTEGITVEKIKTK